MAGDGAQVGKAYVRVLPDTKGFGKELGQQVNNESSGISKAFGGIGTAAAAAFSVGAIGAGIAGVAMFKIGTETEAALNIFQAAAHATGDEMERVSALARDLGNDVTLPGTSAKDASIGMSELAKAGFTVEEAMAAAKGTMQLAAAANIDAGTAAQISANAINAFGLEATEAGRVSDLLAGAANSASGEITDVAAALQQSGAVYASAGIKIEDLTTSIALMANQGIIGSDAGTSLKTMLIALQSPTDKAKGVLDDLGVSVYDGAGNMRDFRDIVDQFGKALPGLTQEQRDQALVTVFGTDALRAANIVLGEGVEKFDAMKASVTEQGAAQKIAEARMKGLGGAVEGLKSQLETLALDGFNLLAPFVESFIRWFSEALPKAIKSFGDAMSWLQDNVIGPTIDWWKDNWPTIKDVAIAAWKAIVNFWKDVVRPVFEGIVDVAASVVDWFVVNWPTIKAAFVTAWDAIKAGFQWLIDNKPVLIGVLLALSAIIVGPFVTAVAAGVLAYQKFEGVREVIDKVIVWIQTVAIPALQQAWLWIQEQVGALTLYVSERWAAIQKAIDNVITYLKVVVAVALAPIVLIWKAAHDEILAIANIIWENIKLVIETAINVIKGIIDVVLGLLSGDWSRAWDGIKQIVEAAWNFMVGTVTLGIEAVKNVVAGVLLVLKGIWDVFWAGLQAAAEAVWEGIKNAVHIGITNVKTVIDNAVDLIKGIWNSTWAAIKGTVENVVGPIINFVQGMIDKIKEGLSYLKQLAQAPTGGGLAPGTGGILTGGLGSGASGGVIPGRAGEPFPMVAHGQEVILNNRQAARVMWSLANSNVSPAGASTSPLTVNAVGVVGTPEELGRKVSEEQTWALRTRAA